MRVLNRETTLCISLAARPGNFGVRFHNHLYEELGLNFVYKACTTSSLGEAVAGVRALGIRGCGVTMPFKEEVLQYLDEIDAVAREIGAVNTIVNTEGVLKGYNTDVFAVRELLRSRALATSSQVVLYGSGGMARAMAYALGELGFRNTRVVARNEHAGRALAERHGFEWLRALPAGPSQVLIHCTPIGMEPNERRELPFNRAMLLGAGLIVESVANPPETELVRMARALGRAVITGGEIAVAQARAQFELYTGVIPTTEAVERAAAFALR